MYSNTSPKLEKFHPSHHRELQYCGPDPIPFKIIFSTLAQNLTLLYVLVVCAITVCGISCNDAGIAFKNSTPSTEPTASPNVVNYGTATDSSIKMEHAKRSYNTESNPVRLRCKDALEKEDRFLCNTLIPLDLRADKVTIDSFEVTYRQIDLNNDGADELLVWESSWAGTSGGGLWVLERKKDGFRKIFETEMTWTPITILSSTHDGWKDFSYLAAGGGLKPTFFTVAYRKGTYRDRQKKSKEQPTGQILIEKNWDPSVFGPIS